MTLHIALDGIEGVGKTTMIRKLVQYFTRKSYSVKALIQPQDECIKYILSTYNLTLSQIALLMAFDRSYTNTSENFENYDIVLWEGSILESIAYNTDENVSNAFIRSINRFFPEMDLYVVITSEQIIPQNQSRQSQLQLANKYQNQIQSKSNVFEVKYVPNRIDEMFESITDIIFKELPTCHWCGRLFTKTAKNKKYCSNTCKHYAKEEQNRNNFRNYYHRYKDTMSEFQKGGLGSKGANLHDSAKKDPEVELKMIKNEKRRLGLKVF